MENGGLETLGWLMIIIVAFWGGRLSKLDKVRIEKVKGPESIVYKIDKIPMNAIAAYLGVQGYEILLKNEAEKIERQAHHYWQEGFKEGVKAGYR